LVDLAVFSVKLLQEIVEIALEPQSRIVGLLSRNVEPRLRLHVLLPLALKRKLVQLIVFDDLSSELGLFLHGV